MLGPRSRSFALLLRTLRRSSAPSAVIIHSFGSRRMPYNQLAPRYSSFMAQDGPQKSTNRPSFAIAAAFEGHEDLEDDEDLDHLYVHEKDEKNETKSERDRSLKEQFQRGMDKKKLWMQSLASQKLYAALIKSVADCYAPLYKLMGLEGKCPLLAVATDAAKGEHELETEFQPQRFDDLLAKATEQEALALLVINKQALLALTVVEHRNELAEGLSRRAKAGTGVVLPGVSVMEEGNAVVLGSHFRMFYSWAVSAYALCGRKYHPQLFDMYDRARDAGVHVTANMNVQYLSALIAERRYDEMFEFYESVLRESQPTSMYFYRNLLFAVSVTHKVELVDSILEDMRVKGFKLRAEDYLRGIRTYDKEYFLKRVQSKDKHRLNQRRRSDRETGDNESMFVTPRDTYQMCMQRIHEQEEHPERFEKIVDAAQSVLGLYDTMVEVDGLVPQHEHFFPRVITAAVYAQECERVPDLLALHASHADKPLHYAGVRMAVNALLLLDKPTVAWDLVRETNPSLEPHRYTLLGNIFSYYCMKNRGADIIKLMHETAELKLHDVFTLSLIKSLVPALCSSVDSVSDEELMETVTRFDDVFHLRTSEHHFGVFLRECCHSKRLAVVKAALKQWLITSENKVPIKGTLAIKLLETFENESDWPFMAEVLELTDFSQVNSEDNRKAIVSAVSRAYEALGQPERVERAERMSLVAGKRQKVGHHQQGSMKQQPESRVKRPSGSAASPRRSKPVMINGIPVASSSSS
uniref:Pentacotripeptide-repeat region of PRORP domain-containing protein n=1 Tax=Hyaloperonospora arabidopsidis (strain Emoy2) TaxID=559515 RepID=M4BRJ1_HYAAE